MKSIDIQPTRPKNILATRVSEVIQNDTCGNGNHIIEKKKVFTSCYVKQLTIVTIHRQRLSTFPQFVKLSKLCNDLEIKVIQGKRNTFTQNCAIP